jgi:hypothetical protein
VGFVVSDYKAGHSLEPWNYFVSGGAPGHAEQLDRPKARTALAEGNSSTTPAPALKPKSNPFGNAKPVDTGAKLLEIEERDAKRKVGPANVSPYMQVFFHCISRVLFLQQG